MAGKKRKRWKLCYILTAISICAGMATFADNCFAAGFSDDLDSQIEGAKAALSEAEQNQKDAAEKYDQGSLGFIDWMLAKTDLTDLQKYDLEKARVEIIEACEEDFSMWKGGNNTGLPEKRNNRVTCLSDYYDAVSLFSMKHTFPMLRKVNAVRDTDENYAGEMHRNEAKTNFYFMAASQTGADRGAGLGDHSLLHGSCENLAFGTLNPVGARWRKEIDAFNPLKEELGLQVLTKESDVSAIKNLAWERGIDIGHYTNLFWSIDQVMGMGYTPYNVTSCYNASDSSDYSSKYALYTIDEFEELFSEYYLTVDPDILQEHVDSAQKALDGLMEQRYEKCSGHVFEYETDKEAACKEGGGTVYLCTKCGFRKTENAIDPLGHDFQDGVCTRCKMTGPKNIHNVTWKNGSDINVGSIYQTYEIGKDVELSFAFETASEYAFKDKFSIDIEDSDILSYTPVTNDSGILHMNAIGKTTLSLYPTENPSLIKNFKVSVTDVGGHDYTISQASHPGSGRTTKTCSKCGFSEEVTLPTNIDRLGWWSDGWGVYTPYTFEIGKCAELFVFYSPDEVDNDEFIIDVSDPSIVNLSSDSANHCLITMVGKGDLTVTVYSKYDPSIKKEHTFTIIDGNETLTGTPEANPTGIPGDDITGTPEASPTGIPGDDITGTPEASPTGMPGDDITGTPEANPTGFPWDNIPETPGADSGNNYVTKPQSISRAVVTLTAASYVYDGKAKTPDIASVRLGHVTLEADKDYTVAYRKNIHIGTAAVIVTGKGDYSGSVTKKFTIKAKQGAVFSAGYYKYKITNQTEASFVGLKNRNIKNMIIPKSVKFGGKAFKVVSIANKACFNTKIQKVTINSNVKKIGSRAFGGCNKLKTMIIKSVTLKSIGKNAFNGIHPMARIKVPAVKLSAYKKLFKNKGQGKNVKIKR